MKGRSIAVFCTAIMLGLSACTSKTELMRRYKSADFAEASQGDPTITVGVFSLAKPGKQPKGLLDLTDRGQATYVEVLGKKAASVEDLQTAMAVGFKAPPSLDADLTRVSRRVVVSIVDNDFSPADRLDRIELTLTLDNSRAPDGANCGDGGPKCTDVRFTGWSLFKTAYEVVDLGKATLVQSQSLEGTLEAGFPQGGVSITPKVSRDLTEEFQVRQRFVALAGILKPESMTMLQEGITGIDLVGTSEIDVNFNLGAGYPTRVYKFSNAEDKVTLASGVLVNPAVACPIKVTLSGQYRIRKVNSGDDTSIEGDDTVKFLTGDIVSHPAYTIVDPRQIANAGYRLRTTPTVELQILRPGRENKPHNYEPMTMLSADQALDFLVWLQGELNSGRVLQIAPGFRFGLRNLGDLSVTPLSATAAAHLFVVAGPLPKCKEA